MGRAEGNLADEMESSRMPEAWKTHVDRHHPGENWLKSGLQREIEPDIQGLTVIWDIVLRTIKKIKEI